MFFKDPVQPVVGPKGIGPRPSAARPYKRPTIVRACHLCPDLITGLPNSRNYGLTAPEAIPHPTNHAYCSFYVI
jgi:hypothetical protein